MEIAHLLRDARRDAGLTQAEMARRGRTSQSTLSAYESGARVPAASTLARLLAAAGLRLTTRPAALPVVRPTPSELKRRGEILVQVLDLAERLPSRRGPNLAYPPLRKITRTDR